VSRPLARLFAYWRTGLSGPVIVLQATASARPLHVALRSQLHGRRGPRPSGRRHAARNVSRRRLVGRRPDASADRSRLAATRPPDPRPAHADEIPTAATDTGADLTRRRMTGSFEHPPRSALPLSAPVNSATADRGRFLSFETGLPAVWSPRPARGAGARMDVTADATHVVPPDGRADEPPPCLLRSAGTRVPGLPSRGKSDARFRPDAVARVPVRRVSARDDQRKRHSDRRVAPGA
jgi:hypothetical protein